MVVSAAHALSGLNYHADKCINSVQRLNSAGDVELRSQLQKNTPSFAPLTSVEKQVYTLFPNGTLLVDYVFVSLLV